METVWRYLQERKLKRHRRTEDFAHPARDPEPENPNYPGGHAFASRSEWLQQVALRHLFSYLVRLVTLMHRLPQAEPRHYRELASWLRAAADSEFKVLEDFHAALEALDRRRGLALPQRKFIKSLMKAAEGADALAVQSDKEIETEIPKAVVAMIARALHELFGKHMYGITATLASLVLNREITETQAREYIGRRKGLGKRI